MTKLKFPRQSSGWKGKRRGNTLLVCSSFYSAWFGGFGNGFGCSRAVANLGRKGSFRLGLALFSSSHWLLFHFLFVPLFFTGRGSGSSLRVRLQPGQTFPFASDETHTGSHGMHVFSLASTRNEEIIFNTQTKSIELFLGRR